jgi:hypothetical protein
MRIFKKAPREEVAKLINKSKETVKKCEDGRSNDSSEDQGILLRRFRYNKDEFQQILNGGLVIPKLPARSAYKTTKKEPKEYRKYQKIISKESRVLKVLRKRNYSAGQSLTVSFTWRLFLFLGSAIIGKTNRLTLWVKTIGIICKHT